VEELLFESFKHEYAVGPIRITSDFGYGEGRDSKYINFFIMHSQEADYYLHQIEKIWNDLLRDCVENISYNKTFHRNKKFNEVKHNNFVFKDANNYRILLLRSNPYLYENLEIFYNYKFSIDEMDIDLYNKYFPNQI